MDSLEDQIEQRDASITEQRQVIAIYKKSVEDWSIGFSEKCARITELEAALKPFADYSVAVDWEVFTPEMHFARSLKFPCDILYGDLRAARAALGEKG